jgi:hypothetical protein
MNMINLFALNLLEVSLTLYNTDSLGHPQTGSPIWTGAPAERLVVNERWLGQETRATGSNFPKKHPLVSQYEISIGRVWLLQTTDRVGFITDHRRYVLDVVWIEEETRDWHRATFFGVTMRERRLSSREIDTGHEDELELDAEAVAVDGGTGTPGPVPTELPYTVVYRTEQERTPLYSYNQTTKAFTLMAAGLDTGRATVSYNPPDQSGTFEIKFAGDAAPTFRLLTDGTFEVGELSEARLPDASDMPRLEFVQGSVRLGAVSQSGIFFGKSFEEQGATEGPGRFLLVANSATQATLEQSRVASKNFKAFVPTQVSGLKLWARAVTAGTQAGGVEDGEGIGTLLDVSGNGSNLKRSVGSPRYVVRPTKDISTQVGLPFENTSVGPALSFIKDPANPGYAEWLKTGSSFLTTIMDGRQFVIFAVMMPFQKDSGGVTSENDLVSSGDVESGPFADSFLLGLTTDRKLFGKYFTNTGAVENAATASGPVWPDFRPAWILAEMEVTATQLILRMNGVTLATTTLVGSADVVSKGVVIGCREDGSSGAATAMMGYMRDVIIYEGNPSAAEKERVRKFLNRAYSIY